LHAPACGKYAQVGIMPTCGFNVHSLCSEKIRYGNAWKQRKKANPGVGPKAVRIGVMVWIPADSGGPNGPIVAPIAVRVAKAAWSAEKNSGPTIRNTPSIK